MGDPPPLDRAIAEQLKKVETTLCLSRKVIVISEDQLELRVQDGIQKLQAKNSWIAPAGILVTCLGTLFTADFKNFSWAAAGTLKGVFVALTIASSVWLLFSLRAANAFGRREFMESIRKASGQYNYAQEVVPSTESQPSDIAAGDAQGVRGAPGFTSPLQCRQCGSILPESFRDQIARCPNCGTFN